MLARNETPGVKRRVRTGCLACRKRRRKCDEHRPSCENCVKRGAQCQYPGFTYVSNLEAGRSGHSSGHSSSLIAAESGLDVEAAAQTRHRPETHPTLVKTLLTDLASPTQNRQQSHSNSTASVATDQNCANLQRSRTTPVGHTDRHVHQPTESRASSMSHFGNESAFSTTSPSSSHLHHVLYKAPMSSSRSPVDSGQISTSNDASPSELLQTPRSTSTAGSYLHGVAKETRLLCHFRYNIAPWLDINDSSAFTGVKLFLVARETRAVMAAILSVAARQLSLKDRSRTGSLDLELCLHYRKEAENRALYETGSRQQLVRLLLLLESFLRSDPQQWRDVACEVVSSLDLMASDLLQEPLQWACVRIDLAAAIVAGAPPLTPYHAWDAWRQTSLSAQKPVTDNVEPILILACSLFLVYRNATESASGAQAMSPEQNHPQSQWTRLWGDCQSWYRRRPEELCPVLKCQAIEAGQIDPSSPASFPIELYSSALALLPNVAYHLASLLLLSCKPRLIKPSADSKRALSESWHVQSIAGSATRNEFKEQWDPILIAGLLYIGPRMTHESQQEALLSCLARANAATGLGLEPQTQVLRSGWTS